MNLKALVGSGDKIILLTSPFLVIGAVMNAWRPALFRVGGPPAALKALSSIVLIPGVILWLWSVGLILTRVPKRRLITGGPYALAKHPLYSSVALLVLPWVGFLFDTWLGALIGAVLYIGSRRYAPAEEETLSKAFGAEWESYSRGVKLPWL